MDGSRACESMKAISESSTHPSTRDEWIASQAASLAKTLARLEKAGVLTASALGSGPSSLVSLATFDPDSHSLRTVQCSLFEDSTACSVTLPRWGSMRNGRLYRRPMLELCIGESGSGFWPMFPTPDTGMSPNGHGIRGGKPGNGHNSGNSLIAMAKHGMWPTPTLGDSRSSGSRNTETSKAHPGLSLTDAVRGDAGKGRMWPTPNARDHKGAPGAQCQANGGHQSSLPTAVKQWPTPTASCRDMDTMERARFSGQQMQQMRDNGAPYQTQTSGSLNPHWVEWLMCWPLGWTRRTGGPKSPKASRASRKASPIASPD
jgi:hypothetical protein